MKSKVFLSLLILFLPIMMSAQLGKYEHNYVAPDTTKVIDTSKTLLWLNDSLFQSILTIEYENIQSLVPKYKLFKVYMDSLYPGIDEINKKAKFATITYRVRKQHKKFLRKTKSLELTLKRVSLDSTNFGEIQTGESSKYTYVTMYLSKKNKFFEVHYLAMEFMGQWCLVDELRLQNYRKVKKKRKRRRL